MSNLDVLLIFRDKLSIFAHPQCVVEDGRSAHENSDVPGCARYRYLGKTVSALHHPTYKYLLNNFFHLETDPSSIWSCKFGFGGAANNR